MKKNDWGVVAATALYSYIFYRQNAGINFLLFTLLVTIILGATRPRTGDQRWFLYAGLAILSGVFVLINGSWLSILANVLSLLVLGGASFNPGSSVIINMVSAGGTIAGSPAFIAGGLYARTKTHNPNQKTYLRGLLAYLIPILVAVLFFVIYRNANPLFAEFTKAINLDFITFGWLMFTFVGLLVCFGLVRAKRFAPIDNWEKQQVMTTQSRFVFSWDERKAATVLFILLNLMLLVMNALDVHYLYLGSGLPEGITHKQFVHKGVGNLILSIVLGITVIVYFFRAELNFGNSRTIKLLVYGWIFQNLFMVLSTAIRNEMYIAEALLTYKRIGVFFWTGLAAAGLCTTIYKIAQKQPAWYLIRSNSFFALMVLVASAAVDWDSLLTNFNLKRIGHLKDLDKRYLLSLGETNFRQLYELAGKEGFENNIYYHYDYEGSYNNAEKLDRKLSDYLAATSEGDWRSFSFRKQRIQTEIAELNRTGRIHTLDLTWTEQDDLGAYSLVNNVKVLKLPNKMRINARIVDQINSFRNLEKIEATSMEFPDLLYFARVKNVENVTFTRLNSTALVFLRKEMPDTDIHVEQAVVEGEERAVR